MDDNLFDTPQTPEEQQRAQRRQVTLKRMAQMANDRIRVFNPTSEDYMVFWDRAGGTGGGFLVPNADKDIGYGKGMAVHPRYIAKKYVTEMTDKLLGEKLMASIEEENEKRIKSGMKAMTKYEEEFNFSMQYRTDNPEKRAAVMRILWRGVEEKYGMNVPSADERRVDPKVVDEDILASLERPATAAPVDFNLDAALNGEKKETVVEEPKTDIDALIEEAAPATEIEENKDKLMSEIAQ